MLDSTANSSIDPNAVCLRRGERTMLTLALREFIEDLANLQEKSAEFCKPWVYFPELSTFFEKVDKQERIGFMLWNSSEQSLIAVININNPVYGGFLSGHLGYYIDGAYANNGFMAEGLSLALDYAFNELGFNRLEANIQPGNTASKRLVEKLGFRLEGFSPKYLKINNVWCDHERWAILSEEWNQSEHQRNTLIR